MTESQSKYHLKNLTASNYAMSKEIVTDNSPSNSLGVTSSAAMQYLQLSEPIVTGIWVKAQALLVDPTAISFVLLRSGTVPHLVKHTSKGYKCGDQCTSFKSNGICY